MKNLLACLAVLLAFSSGAQSMPYNPDANNDGYIGSPDLLSLLPLFGSEIGIDSTLTCDYEGSTLDQWLGDFWSGILEIDSILVQYTVLDTASYFLPGCPDAYEEVISLERSYVCHPAVDTDEIFNLHTSHLGYDRWVSFQWYENQGAYIIHIDDWEIEAIGLLGNVRAYATDHNNSNELYIPIPGELSEIGLEMFYWNGFLSNSTFLNLIPYWHYIE